jgi:hypothetical protein
MPVRIRIDVNGRDMQTLWIGRMEGNEEPDSINTYIIGHGTEHLEAWNVGSFYTCVEFTHRYGDGLERCVELGMAALFGDTVVKSGE